MSSLSWHSSSLATRAAGGAEARRAVLLRLGAARRLCAAAAGKWGRGQRSGGSRAGPQVVAAWRRSWGGARVRTPRQEQQVTWQAQQLICGSQPSAPVSHQSPDVSCFVWLPLPAGWRGGGVHMRQPTATTVLPVELFSFLPCRTARCRSSCGCRRTAWPRLWPPQTRWGRGWCGVVWVG